MIELTEPQIWVLIAIFGATMFSIIGIQTASFNRNLTTSIASLRESFEAKFDGLRAEMNARFEAVDARFDATNTKIDALDRDVQALSHRVFGTE